MRKDACHSVAQVFVYGAVLARGHVEVDHHHALRLEVLGDLSEEFPA